VVGCGGVVGVWRLRLRWEEEKRRRKSSAQLAMPQDQDQDPRSKPITPSSRTSKEKEERR
jgi:hypothetical protein